MQMHLDGRWPIRVLVDIVVARASPRRGCGTIVAWIKVGTRPFTVPSKAPTHGVGINSVQNLPRCPPSAPRIRRTNYSTPGLITRVRAFLYYASVARSPFITFPNHRVAIVSVNAEGSVK